MSDRPAHSRAHGSHRPVRAIVIDDEPLAREGVRALLSSDPEVEVVDVCASGVSAVRKIVDLSPDLVFLDIQMPGMNGFDVIRAIGTEDMPVVIFATAYDRYALDAFEAHAVEYLLKPFSDERFHEALARGKLAVRERRMAELGEKLSALLQTMESGRPPANNAAAPQRLAVRGARSTYFVSVEDIDWIEGADYYASVHAAGKAHLVRESLASLAERLGPHGFVRVHRSAIVNARRVKQILSTPRRDQFAVLHDGTRVRLARGAKARLEAELGDRE
jgi:two-component system LytT family response regulator